MTGQATWSTWTSRSWAASLPGGGHRVHGRATGTVNRRADRSSGGYDYLHAAVDDHSRLAYVEILGDERAQSCARFWRRAHHWFALHGITVTSVLTDNGVGYRSRLFRTALSVSTRVTVMPCRANQWWARRQNRAQVWARSSPRIST